MMTEAEAREIVERYDQLLRSALRAQKFTSDETVGHQLSIVNGQLSLNTGWPTCSCGHAHLDVESESLAMASATAHLCGTDS